MAYRPNMSFIPETLENLIERLRISAQDKLGYTSNTNEEFMASNLWLVYYAVALMKNQTDILFEELLDKVFDYFLETYGSLKQDEGSSTNGLNKIFSNHTKGFEMQTFHNNEELDLGELRICLLKPDLPALKTKLEDYFDFTIKTNVGNPLPTEKLVCDVGFSVDFHYTLAKVTPLYLAISYYFISEYVPTGKEKEIILAEFLNKWDKFQTLGKDFLPDVYLGNNENLPFLASISVGYRTHLEDTFIFEPKIHEFGECFYHKNFRRRETSHRTLGARVMINGILSFSGAKIKNFSDTISLKSLDYSENRINTKMSDISSFLWSETYTSLLAVNFNDDWWAKKIKAKNMLHLFEITSGNEHDIYKALLFCYSHQGSTKGIVKLCLALFGKNAHIEFILKTNKLDIMTDIDNLNFLKVLTTNHKIWLTTHNNRGLIAETFEKLGTSQLTLFLQGFMHPSKQICLTIQQHT